ncbi:type III secretion system export apparatus subunit SctV [Trinickia mobilis]|uniref:type III secretion system export apparatus subunit SctV n=1 Tax=Trinickia mobilis TaxID=2816356 RepID=UPI001A90C6D7|nr:type III secretion system export apparatus subunit SctV [Trinickia mobilis]
MLPPPVARALARISTQRSEIVVATLVMTILFMMIVPLPTALLDVLIALNIGASALLIVMSLYLPGPLHFSSFPAVLLLTTLFRLGIEIGTTRLILLHGDAGEIVETFGRFLAGDNLTVGLIIFLIVTVVQFLVITKGAERVAEVSARFSLDSVPGKQMAIDSDLRAGLIAPDAARARRDMLASESQMHGALDGAMKFVKGDAIAGLVIVLVNLVGGIAIGTMQRGMSVGEAVEHYSVLTIGDGLIAQIPALLISMAAGMIITRVARSDAGGGGAHHALPGDGDGDDAPNVGREIAAQLLALPQAWLVASCIMLLFALVPGMPWPVFIALAAGGSFIGMRRLRKGWALQEEAAASARGADDPIPDDQDLRRFVPARRLVLKLSAAMHADPASDAFVRAMRRVRNRIVLSYGLTIPEIEVEADDALAGDAYVIEVQEVPVLRARLRPGELSALAPELALREAGIDARRDDVLAPFAPHFWLTQDEADAIDVPAAHRCSAHDHLGACFERVSFRYAASFVTIQEAHALSAWIEREMPEAAAQLQKALPLPRFADVLRRLAAERVSIRNLRQIIETLIEWAPRERDIALLTEYVRVALGPQICAEFAHEGTLRAILIDPELEGLLRDAVRETAHGAFLVLDPDTQRSLLDQIGRHLAGKPIAQPAPVIVTTQDLRRLIRMPLVDEFFDVHVLSFTELSAAQRVEPIFHLQLENRMENVD